MNNIRLLSSQVIRGNKVTIHAYEKRDRKTQIETIKELKTFKGNNNLRTLDGYKGAVRHIRRTLKDSFNYSTTYQIEIHYKKPKHYKFLNNIAQKHYTNKITGNYSEQLTVKQLTNRRHDVRKEILNHIIARQQRIANLRRLSRTIGKLDSGTTIQRYVNGFRVELPVDMIICVSTKDINYGNTSCGYTIFRQPGSILKLSEIRRAKRVFQPKKPTTDERHVSVEIEFAIKMNMQELGAKLYQAGVADYVHLKTDGSVRDFAEGYNAFEISVCMPASKRDDILFNTLKVLNDNGARVNRTCGLHVHLDMRGYNHRKAFSNLVSAQTILYKMVPSSRRTNTYCAKTVNKNYDHYSGSSNRYLGINPQSYRKYGTIEVRLHSGTTDFAKITNFVDILTAVGYNDKEIVRGASTVGGFIKQHNLSKDIESYINQRIALFGNSSQEEAA